MVFAMLLSIDLGGSTIDLVGFEAGQGFTPLRSFESEEFDKADLASIWLKAGIDAGKIEKIAVTGGFSRQMPPDIAGIPVRAIYEIDAIGRGGLHLAKTGRALVCSMGTGTCLVSAGAEGFRHIGGTGVGGGSFMGLARAMLGIHDFEVIKQLAAQGTAGAVDLSVAEIVGGGIGMVPPEATAANFAKADETSKKADLAKGIARLVGQTIASLAVFGARAAGHDTIVLGGKLIRLPEVLAAIESTAKIYGQTVIVPDHAEILSAIGAGLLAQE